MEDNELVQSQIEAVLGCAEALEECIKLYPEEYRKGIQLSVLLLRTTAESFTIEHF